MSDIAGNHRSDLCYNIRVKISRASLIALVLISTFMLRPVFVDAAVVGLGANKSLTNGLIGYWTFDGKDMVPNVRDMSGSGNTGRLVNFAATTTVSGQIGQALSFVSSNSQYVNTATTLDLGSSFSWSIWLKIKPNQTGFPFGVGPYKRICYVSSRVYFDVNSDCTAGVGTTNTITDDAWHHYVMVSSGTNQYLYVDGVYNNSGSRSVNAATAVAVIGQCESQGYFTGSIDDVRIYNRVLSASEAMQLYNMGRAKVGVPPKTRFATTTGVVGHWTFDGKDLVNNVADVSGISNHGWLSSAGRATSTLVRAGILGQGLQFYYGVTNYRVSLNKIVNAIATGDVSIALWIKPTDTVANASVIFHLGDTPSTNDIFLQYGNFGLGCGTGLSFGVQLGAITCTNATGYSTINLNQWYHVVGTYNTVTGSKIYVDGVMRNSDPTVGRGVTASAAAQLGGETSGAGSSRAFNGVIDDVWIFNRTISATEVANLYAMGKSKMNVSAATSTANASGLVGYWTFDGKNLTPNVRDSSLSGIHGRIIGQTSTTTVAGKIGQAMYFDAVNDYISLPSTPITNVANPNTICAWVKVNTTSGDQTIMGNGVDGSNYIMLHILSGGGLAYTHVSGGTSHGKSKASMLTANTWSHACGVWDGTAVSLYKDGVALTSLSDVSYLPTGALIGSRNASADRLMNGAIDEVRVYNRALTAAQILQLYNSR